MDEEEMKKWAKEELRMTELRALKEKSEESEKSNDPFGKDKRIKFEQLYISNPSNHKFLQSDFVVDNKKFRKVYLQREDRGEEVSQGNWRMFLQDYHNTPIGEAKYEHEKWVYQLYKKNGSDGSWKDFVDDIKYTTKNPYLMSF
jgi:hypothetical protein